MVFFNDLVGLKDEYGKRDVIISFRFGLIFWKSDWERKCDVFSIDLVYFDKIEFLMVC